MHYDGTIHAIIFYTHTHTHMCVHSHAHTCTHTHVRALTHTCTHTHVRTLTCTHMHTHTCAHTHTHTCTHSHTHARTHTHTCTHTHTHTHTHTQALGSSVLAYQCFKLALVTNNNHSEAYNNLGVLEWRRGRGEQVESVRRGRDGGRRRK